MTIASPSHSNAQCHTLTDSNYHHSVDLSQANTMALACIADKVICLNNETQLDDFMLSYRANHGDKEALFVLSGGSNVLLPAALQAIVLRPDMRGITVIAQTADAVDIEVMAGENWHDLVTYTVDKGWYGLENLALIPGLTGAAPVQNIGAYGVQLEDCLLHVRAYHLPTQTWHELSKEDCHFGYRDSIFKRSPNTWLISRVRFRLHTNPAKILANYGDVQVVAERYAKAQGRHNATPYDVMPAIMTIRQSKLPDPKQLPNCGSFFQNPIISNAEFERLCAIYPDVVGYPMLESQTKVAAGWLIEQAGLKGGGIEPIMTHQQQALVLTNHAPYQATQENVIDAQNFISDGIYDKFGIRLSREPIWVNADGSIGHHEYAS